MKKKMAQSVIGALLLIGGMNVMDAQAAAAGSADMTFRGTLVEPPPCTINNSSRIDVDFGDRLGITKVDGVNYRQPMNYQITCENNANGSWALTLSLSGAAASFDVNALQTSKPGLGVRVYQNDMPFRPGSTLPIDLANPPRLEAVPVQNAGAPLTEGAFEAWATLRADYR